MRFDRRLLGILTVLVCITLIFYGLSISGATTTIHDHVSFLKENHGWVTGGKGAPKGVKLSKTLPSSTYDLWQFWSPAFEAGRPKVEQINLRSHAANVAIDFDDTNARRPPHDRVTNPPQDIETLRVAHAKFLSTLLAQEESGENVFNGRGVVMVGGGEYFGPAIVGIHMLRKSGSDLPVEVFVADKSEWEDEICKDYLPKLGARCFVITDFLQTKSRKQFEVTHYQLKSLAMLFCSFADVLYLDSDSIPLLNPDKELFKNEPYKTSGLVIWPDFWIASESPQYYKIAGLFAFPDGLPKSSSEAGQLLINKKTHLKTLLLANYYNVYGPDLYYPLLSQGALGQGDKETFLAAATVLGEPWYRVRTAVEAVGRVTGGEVKGSAMVQHHPFDDLRQTQVSASEHNPVGVVRPAFLHANTPKMNAGHLIDEGDLLDEGQRLRLWGALDDQMKEFGVDLEKTVWELLVQTGCELQHVIKEWKPRERMCERLKEHRQGSFEKVVEEKMEKNDTAAERVPDDTQ